MKRGVRILSTAQVAAGFRAAGLPTLEADDPTAAAVALAPLLDDAAVGVIMIEERLHDALPDELRARIARLPLPLVIPFPDPVWEPKREAAEAYVVELLRRAIGYRVRLA